MRPNTQKRGHSSERTWTAEAPSLTVRALGRVAERSNASTVIDRVRSIPRAPFYGAMIPGTPGHSRSHAMSYRHATPKCERKFRAPFPGFGGRAPWENAPYRARLESARRSQMRVFAHENHHRAENADLCPGRRRYRPLPDDSILGSLCVAGQLARAHHQRYRYRSYSDTLRWRTRRRTRSQLRISAINLDSDLRADVLDGRG